MAVCGLSSMEAVQLVQPRTQHRSLCPFLSQIEAWSPFPSLYYIQNFSNQKHKTGHGSGHEVSINSKWNAIIICNIQKKKKMLKDFVSQQSHTVCSSQEEINLQSCHAHVCQCVAILFSLQYTGFPKIFL